MPTLRIHDLLKDRILVTRESARQLMAPLQAMWDGSASQDKSPDADGVTVDFDGVEGMAPSFLDELISVFEAVTGREPGERSRCLVVANPPTRLSLKFEAVARGHGMTGRAAPDGSWLLTRE